jgi:hypothetical protein
MYVKVKESLNGATETFMMDNGLIIKNMVKGFTLYKMAILMKGNGKWIK